MFLVEKMNTNEKKCINCNKTIYAADKYEKYEGKVCFIKINFKKILFLFFFSHSFIIVVVLNVQMLIVK
jgi:hypothetical protein